MHILIDYINALPVAARDGFAARCGTTIGYLRKAVSVGQRIKAETCINIERESGGAVACEDLRPDVDWATVRVCKDKPIAPATQGWVAINPEAPQSAKGVA